MTAAAMVDYATVTYVRRAKLQDVPWLLDQLQQFSVFFGTKRSLFPDELLARRQVSHLVDRHPFYVAAVNGHPVGFIAGALDGHAYNPEIRVLTELFWWVAPEHRNSRAGLMLLNEFVRYGREHADWIVFTLEHNSPVNDRTLLKRGFKHYSRDFLLEVTR